MKGDSGTAAAVPKAARLDASGDRPVVLEVNGLTKRFGGINAVNDVTFSLHEGEIIGLIGPNGAGKTTIFDILSACCLPTTAASSSRASTSPHGAPIDGQRSDWAALSRTPGSSPR